MTTRTPGTLQGTRRLEHDDPPTRPRARGSGVRAVWRHPVAVLALPLAAGLGLGASMPRGPATAATALVTIAVTFVVGVAAGRGWRSRWSYLLVPATLAVGYELARISVSGPSIDLPSVTTMFGWLALIGGRGMLALVAGLPAVLGVAAGRHASTELLRSPLSRGGRLVIMSALLVVALSVAFGRPARTAPIVVDDGEVLDGSIATLERVPVNGHDLGIMVRGHDVDNPVALFLAGGPGGTELGAMRRHLPMLEEHMTVVTWDQRGTGRSYGALDPVETYTVESAVGDTIALSEYLRERFGKDRIHLIGQSWGTTLGVLAVQQRPDLYETYVGVGQMVSQTATDRRGYQDTLAWARDGGRDELVATLEANGPPPYEDVRHYEHALSHEPAVYAYDHSGNSEGAGGFSDNLLVEEYALVDLFHVFPGFLDTASVLYPQLEDIDFRNDVTRLEVPVHFVQGRHETRARAEVFEEWFPVLDAPAKRLVVFDRSGHRPMFEQPEAFTDYMVEEVLASTAG